MIKPAKKAASRKSAARKTGTTSRVSAPVRLPEVPVRSSGPRRARGRPLETAGEDLQARLLDLAELRFAERGYAATSLRTLAEEAGVTPALLHYYFGSKRELLLAVMHRALEPLAAAVAGLRTAPEVAAREMTALVYGAVSRHPTLPRLMVREVLLGERQFRDYFAEHFAPRLGAALVPVVRVEQEHGHLSREFHAGTVVLMILGLCLFPFVARPVAEPMLGVNYDEAGRKQLFAQINRLLEQGLAP